jgi:precorrin-2 dehydrogenase/sirohydrochlorin ferrochelatase
MKYLPLNMAVEGRTCLLVGGGEVAARKATTLLEFGARVHVVARELSPELQDLVVRGRVQSLGPEYQTEHLNGAVLVFAATSDTELNQRVSREAMAAGIPVNVVDQPELCSFIVPASVVRGDLVISISTSGASPALAASLRRKLEDEFGPEYDYFLKLMAHIRPKLLAEGRGHRENRQLFRALVDSGLLDFLAAEKYDEADRVLAQVLGPDYVMAESLFGQNKGGEN